MDEEMRELTSMPTKIMSLAFYAKQIFSAGSFSRANKEELKKQELKQKCADMAGECFGSHNFVFTGGLPDMSYFYLQDKLPLSLVAELEEPLRSNTSQTFENCVKEGLLYNDGQTLYLSSKGREFILTDEFLEKAQAEQNEAWEYERQCAAGVNVDTNTVTPQSVTAESTTFEFDGTDRDLNVFKATDKINISEAVASTGNEELALQATKNFYRLKEYGVVSIDDDGVAELTSLGNEIVKNPVFVEQSGNVDALFGKAENKVGVEGVAGKGVGVISQSLSAVATITHLTQNDTQTVAPAPEMVADAPMLTK